jgi:hypothetical protein
MAGKSMRACQLQTELVAQVAAAVKSGHANLHVAVAVCHWHVSVSRKQDSMLVMNLQFVRHVDCTAFHTHRGSAMQPD